MANPDVYEILNRLQTPDAKVLRQAIENLKTERDFERHERFRLDELRSELVFAFGFQVEELRKKRDEWQATAEKAIDASSEGTWMARALDAERELAALKAECLKLRELHDSIDNLRVLRSSCPDSTDGDFRVHLSEKEWDMVTHLMDTCKKGVAGE